MMTRRILLIAAIAATSVTAAGTAVGKNIDLVTLPARQSVQLTIYIR